MGCLTDSCQTLPCCPSSFQEPCRHHGSPILPAPKAARARPLRVAAITTPGASFSRKGGSCQSRRRSPSGSSSCHQHNCLLFKTLPAADPATDTRVRDFRSAAGAPKRLRSSWGEPPQLSWPLPQSWLCLRRHSFR